MEITFSGSIVAGHTRTLQRIVAGAPLDQIFAELVQTFEAGTGGAGVGSILLLDHHTQRLRLGAAPSLPDVYTTLLDGLEIGPGLGACAEAAYRGEVVITPDIANAPNWASTQHLPLALGFRSVWSMPILAANDHVLGTFGTYFRECRTPTSQEMDMVSMLAHTAAIAIERKQSEQRLRENEERFRLLADNMSQFAWIADEHGWIFWYNQRWFDYTGTALEDMQGWGWTTLTHPDYVDDVVVRMKEAWETGEPWEDTFPLRSKDGYYCWFLSRAVPVRDATGRIVLWFGTNTDITEQRETEAALQEAKEAAEAANRDKDRFLARLSHELRTPLTPVLMAVQDMEVDDQVPEAVRQELGMVHRHIELEARLIDDLLDLTRIEQGKLELHVETIDIHAVLLHALETCRDSDIAPKRLRVRTDLQASSPITAVDAARIEQVFWNLIKNASKFTPPDGSITVQSCDDEAGGIVIQVTDTGIGITPEAMPRLFNAFEQGGREVTRRYGGLGLGLAISKAMVELHCGSIRAESDGLDCGTTITVTLPRVTSMRAQSPSADVPNASEQTSRTLHILLVEDHEPTLKVMARLLRRRGYDVVTAATVQEALRLAEPGRFDLLISDIGLPDGTGYDLMSALRQRCDLKGIALSGYGMEEDVRLSHHAGFLTHIIKPVNLKMLEAAIERVLMAP